MFNNRIFQYLFVLFCCLLVIVIFITSCVITLSDAQGVFVFIFSIPLIVIFLFFAIFYSKKIKLNSDTNYRVDYFPKFIAVSLILFFISLAIPGIRMIPVTFIGLVGGTFTYITGKTPYLYFKERASFPNKLAGALKSQNPIKFSDLTVIFAWDKVCIFGPYTNNQKARLIHELDFNIEERSKIHISDSINALVFIYQGKVNTVVDLERGLADFKKTEICLMRDDANYQVLNSADGRKILDQLK